MSAPFKIDVDAVTMFSGHTWWDLGDVCAHDCTHSDLTVVAWGPDVAHYELVECAVAAGGCGCRAWWDGREQQERDRSAADLSGFWRDRIVWHSPALGSAAS